MTERGFYIIKNEFFDEMNEPYLKSNKEGNRPHYYCIKEEQNGLLWMIPISSKIEKYKRIVNEKEKQHKPCDIIHIAKLYKGRESVFLIQDMFPITKKYIEREYTIANKHLIITNQNTAIEIERKSKKVIKMLKHGIKFTPTQCDIIRIIDKLNKG